MRALILCALLGVALPAAALSQKVTDLQQGTRVIVTDRSGTEVKGRLIRISTDSMFVSLNPAQARTVPMSNVRSVKVAHVSHLRGLALGAAIGVVIGGVGGAVLGGMDDSCSFLSCGRGENAAFAAGAFGTVGLVLGSLFGVMGGKEVWQPLPMPLYDASGISR